MSNPKIETLIETAVFSQKLAYWYLSKLKNVDPHKVFEVNGIALNTLYWTVGHIAWGENDLIIKATHGQAIENDFLENFAIGKGNDFEKTISFEELLVLMKEVHALSVAHLKTFSDQDLSKINKFNEGFGTEPTYQTIIMHHIRHLGVHTGHLSLLCKLYHINTV